MPFSSMESHIKNVLTGDMHSRRGYVKQEIRDEIRNKLANEDTVVHTLAKARTQSIDTTQAH